MSSSNQRSELKLVSARNKSEWQAYWPLNLLQIAVKSNLKGFKGQARAGTAVVTATLINTGFPLNNNIFIWSVNYSITHQNGSCLLPGVQVSFPWGVST